MLQLSPWPISSRQGDIHQHAEFLTIGHGALWSRTGWCQHNPACNQLSLPQTLGSSKVASEPLSGLVRLFHNPAPVCMLLYLPVMISLSGPLHILLLFDLYSSWVNKKSHPGWLAWLRQEVSIIHSLTFSLALGYDTCHVELSFICLCMYILNCLWSQDAQPGMWQRVQWMADEWMIWNKS